MIKSASKIEIKIGERVHQFVSDADSPIGEVYDVLCQMKYMVFQKIQEFEQPKEEDKSECCSGVCE